MKQWYEQDSLPVVFPDSRKEDEKKVYDNPIYTLEEFIAYTQAHPYDFISYCEVVIAENGNILLARPSHTVTLHSIVRQVTKGTDFEFSVGGYADELLDLSKCVSVWYGHQEAHFLSPKQKEALKRLAEKGLIVLNVKKMVIDCDN